MAIGPVQLLVVGFSHPQFQGEIRKELDRLRDNDLVQVIDVLAVRSSSAPSTSSPWAWWRPQRQRRW